MRELIVVNNLSKFYGQKKAVDNLSFTVEKGKIFGLLGANGAGKSTTIECMLGTKSMDNGTVSILDMDPKVNRKELFEKVGVQFQEANYQDNIRVEELCKVTASLYRQPLDYKTLLIKFGIADKQKTMVKDLSGGQRQRLFIILALLPNPEVVFLDELTTGLDARARRSVWQIIGELKKQGITIMLTSHFMDEVELLCDTICILKKGVVVFMGTIKEAIEKSPYNKLEDAYLWYSDEEVFEYEGV